MPKSWKDVIGNSELGDSTEIEIGGEKLTIGELRKFQQEREAALAADVAAREEGVQQILQAFKDAPAATTSQTTTSDRAASPADTSGFDYDSDPLFGPLSKRLSVSERKQQEILDALRTMGQGNAQQVAAALEIQFKDILDRRKSDFPGVDYDSAIRYARENNIVNKRGIFDPIRAADEMSRQSRQEAAIAAAKEQGAKEAIERLQQETGVRAIALPGISRNTGADAFRPDPKQGLQANMKQAIAKVFGGR